MQATHKNIATTLRRAFWSGTAASIFSGLTVAWRAHVERVGALRGINAVSHWLRGDRAFHQTQPSLRYTLPAVLVHHASSVFWSTIYEQWLKYDDRQNDVSVKRIVKRAASVTALAWFIDYHLTPKRFTPGFEHVISRRSLVMTYTAFGCGLGAISLWSAYRRKIRTQRRQINSKAQIFTSAIQHNEYTNGSKKYEGAELPSEKMHIAPSEWTPPLDTVRH